ncbi:MAG TPA: hypothetical protein VHV51_16400 [Polyangiaceae bacterium]|nr:hypothetical protein [Polyangiaceae bacterium]
MKLLCVVALLSLVACAANAPRSASDTPKNTPKNSREDDFRQMSWEERHDQMTWGVLPTMAERFQAFSGSADATLTCRSCHGPDPEAVSYRMPRSLPALDPAHLPQANDADARGRTAKFMIETVTPTMADLLGEPLYDAKTRSGFGCFNCHPSLAQSDRRTP